MDLLKAQVKNLTANPGSATEGNAELLDIRVGADGRTYDTAGEAVRTQFTNVDNYLNEHIDQFGVNLARLSNLVSVSSMKVDYESIDDHTMRVNNNSEAYGRIIYRFKNENPSFNRKYFIASKMKVIESKGVIRVTIYGYTDLFENLGEFRLNLANTKILGDYVYSYGIVDTTTKTKDIAYFDIGMMNAGVGSSWEVTDDSMILVDITDIPDLSIADCVGLFGLEYFLKRSTALTALTYTSDDLVGFATNPSIDESTGEILISPTTTYGAVGIKTSTLLVGNKYVVIWKGFNFANAALMKASGSGWNSAKSASLEVDGTQYHYAVLTPVDNDNRTVLYLMNLTTADGDVRISNVSLTLVSNYADISENLIRSMINSVHYDIASELTKILATLPQVATAMNLANQSTKNHWKDKKVLVIGDSITAAGRWQLKLSELLGMQVSTHAKGGIGTIQMVDGDKGLGGDYDNETSASGVIKPLSTDDVSDKDLIIVLPAYNNRGTDDGSVGDCYNPAGGGQNTIAGMIQYTINRIYEELKSADNLTCKVLYATPHCAGRYPYIDADGYEEYPAGSGRTMETLANIIVQVCNHNNIRVCDLWHNSGINKFTWTVFGSSKSSVNEQYSPYQLDSEGNHTSDTRIRYTKGQSYYQIRDGVVVLEEYTGSSPYPYNGDQLHCSPDGYARIGECIVGAVISNFGN